ncbi:MAG: MarP family serine protease [Actinobacteria bacterium]|nr:MarP family serine protease [Actinomycetota bacterium]
MNLLDLVIVVLLLLAVSAGYQMGFVRRVAGWIGFAIGAVVGWRLSEAAARAFEGGTPAIRVMAAAAVVLTVGSMGGAIGEAVGRVVRRAVPRGPARAVDSAAGGVAGLAAVLAGVWLAFPVLANIPGGIAREAHTSAIVGFVRDIAPTTPPQSLQALGDRLAKVRFPDIHGLQRAPDLGSPPSVATVPDAVVQRVAASTVNVEAFGCGGRHEGSGWTVGQNTVVTNAHVVAGAERVRLRRPDQRLVDATVVVFDDNRDIAVLDAPGLGQSPLPLGNAGTGTNGIVVGYPGGVDRPVVSPAAIRREQPTVGRDIYHRDRVRRQVLFLAARLQRGDSGSPLADAQGRVVGMAFAVAPDRQATAYALDDSEVRATLGAPRRPGTGSCI